MSSHLVWGCDPNFQYETSWIRFLLEGCYDSEFFIHDSFDRLHSIPFGDHIFLVESGLNRLRKNITIEELNSHDTRRAHRLDHLINYTLSIIHLSDEEGHDGDSFYSQLSPETTIYRNFYHERFGCLPSNVKSFPIGPRSLFLPPSIHFDSTKLVDRVYPWSFMGTIWSSGSRKLAVSTFLRSLPEGFFFGGTSFSQGLPLSEYRGILLNSHFAIAPEGDRHLDTFRLWEALSCGCIPVVVDFKDTAQFLLEDYPLPIYGTWKHALEDVTNILINKPNLLPVMHEESYSWWLNYISKIKSTIISSDSSL